MRPIDGSRAAPANPARGPVLPLVCRSLAEALDVSLAIHGGRTAIVDARGAQSHADLRQAGYAVAERLCEERIAVGDRVVLLGRRSAAMVAAQIGCLFAGAVPVPLDPTHPVERVRMLRQEARPRITFSTDWGTGQADADIHRLDPFALPGLEAAGPVSSDADLPAVVYFTSGSTGRPKGVLTAQDGILNEALWTARAFALEPGTKSGWTASSAFAVSRWEVWSALLAGAEIHVAEDADLAEGPAFVSWLQRTGVEITFLATARAGMLRRDDFTAGCRLRVLIVGGDVLRAVPEVPESCALVNAFGITEASSVRSVEPLKHGGVLDGAIGWPIINTQLYVVRADGSLAGLGETGEIHVGGTGLALGYLDRPEATADRFVRRAFSDGTRVYRTGDLGRIDPETGRVLLSGRAENDGKFGGERISVEEIEQAIAVVLGRPDLCVVDRGPTARPRLVAWLAENAWTRPEAGLRRALRERLPAAACPDLYCTARAMPLNAHGKLDRVAVAAWLLPTWYGERSLTEAEMRIGAIWQEITGLAPRGPDDRFFATGATSLDGLRLLGRIERDDGVRLDLGDLFADDRLSQITARIEAMDRRRQNVAARRADASAALPVTLPALPEQAGIWFAEQASEGCPRYNEAFLLTLDAGLDRARIVRVVRSLLASTDALRLTIREAEGDLLVAPATPERIDSELAALEAETETADPDAVAARLMAAPLDISAGPLFRARLVRDPEGCFVLVLVLHHAIADGWSLGALARDLARHLAANELEALPAAPSYRTWMAQRTAERRAPDDEDVLAAAFGPKGCYAGFESGMEQAPRPFSDTQDGPLVVETLPLDQGEREGLAAFARDQRTTLFRVGLLAFATLLCRLGDRDGSLIGAFVSARRGAEDDDTIGLMTQTAALPVRLDEESSVAEALAATGPALAAGLAVSRAGMTRLGAAFGERGMDVAALPTFSHEQDAAAPGAGVVAMRHQPSPFAKFPLSVTLMEDADGALRLVGEAAAPGAALRVFLERLRRVLGWISRNAHAALAACPILLDGEEDRVFAAGRGVSRPQPGFPTVSHGIEADLAARPDTLALTFEGRRFSARQVLALIGGLDGLLGERGVGPGDRVAVHSGPSVVCAIAMVAIWRRGAAFVPIDAASPAARLAQIADVAGPKLIITVDDAEWPATGPVLALDTDTLERHAQPPSGPSVAVPHGIAWVYFTSGSTGVPKGVAVAHRAARNHALLAEAVSDILPLDRVLQFASPSFDAYIEEIVFAWTHAATLVIRDASMMGSPARFFARIREQGVTVLDLPTAWFHFLVAGLNTDEARAALASIHTVIFSGEAARPDAVDAWRGAVSPACRLVNLYGPTECTISCTYGHLRDPGCAVSVGVAAPNTYCRILDRRRRPLPFETYGELYFGGPCLAEGYAGAPDKTAERFVSDPYGETGARLYATGDRAMLCADGTIHVSGRQDEMVKIRSQRLELGDLEIVARQHPDLADAAAFLPGTEPFADHLMMAVVPRDPKGFDPQGFRAHIARHLPAVAVPQRLLILDRIPLTTANKIDRRSLRALAAQEARDASHAAEDPIPDEASTEAWLIARFRAALDDPCLPADADFFLSGGNSLLAMRLLGEIARRFGVGLLYSEFRVHPTPERLATLIEERGPALAAPEPAPPPVPTDLAPPLPIQAAKLATMVESGDHGAWNQPYVAAFEDGIDAARLDAALDRLATEHFALSAVWDVDAGLWRRGRGRSAHIRRAVPDAEAARAVIAQESWRPFDVTREPLFRVVQADLPDGSSWLAFVSHNIMVSGQANDYFTAVMDEASTGAGEVRPREIDFPHLVAWRAAWERDHRAGARETWIDRGATIHAWPAYEGAAVNPVEHRVAILPQGAEAEFVVAMQAASVTVAAGLARILQGLSETQAGFLGVLVDGREAAGFGGVFAPMAATLPLVLDAEQRGDLAAIQDGLDRAIDAYPFTLSMLEQGLREAGRLAEGEKAAFVTLSVEQPMAAPVIGGRRGRWLREVNGALRRADTKTVFPLALNVEVDPHGWIVEVTFSTQLVGGARAETILNSVVAGITGASTARRST